jgi:hypothetical protein
MEVTGNASSWHSIFATLPAYSPTRKKPLNGLTVKASQTDDMLAWEADEAATRRCDRCFKNRRPATAIDAMLADYVACWTLAEVDEQITKPEVVERNGPGERTMA